MAMNFDVAIIGGGLAGMTAALALHRAGLSTAVISSGRSIHAVDYRTFRSEGGTLLLGDSAERIDGHSIYTSRLGSGTPIDAGIIVLAGGKFFGGGIVSDMEGIREPLLGADVECDGTSFAADFMDEQPFMRFGVRTDADGHVLIGGSAAKYVFACGEILAGISAADKDSDRQITDSALKVAQKIISDAGKGNQQV